MADITNGATAPEHTTPTSDDELASIGLHNFDPVLTTEQLEAFEHEQSTIWRPKRRLALIALTRSKDQLVKGCAEGSGIDTLFEMVEHINEWSEHLKVLLEMSETATARLLVTASAILHSNTTATQGV